MGIPKDFVMEDLYHQIARSEKSTTSQRGLIHMVGAVQAADEYYVEIDDEGNEVKIPHDIHYYCRIMEEWK